MVILLALMLAAQPKIGFGIGQTLPGHLLVPSLFTMRIPLGKSFVIAPELNFAYSAYDGEVGNVTGAYYTIGIEGNLSYRILKREGMRLYAIAGIGFELSRDRKEWYEGTHWPRLIEELDSSHSYGLNLGLGMEQFLRTNLSIYIASLSNIRVSYRKMERTELEETVTIREDRDFSINFQNLRCAIYLIWYIL